VIAYGAVDVALDSWCGAVDWGCELCLGWVGGIGGRIGEGEVGGGGDSRIIW
jgi:hypothetical protein